MRIFRILLIMLAIVSVFIGSSMLQAQMLEQCDPNGSGVYANDQKCDEDAFGLRCMISEDDKCYGK